MSSADFQVKTIPALVNPRALKMGRHFPAQPFPRIGDTLLRGVWQWGPENAETGKGVGLQP